MAGTPIHPGEHLAEELKELGISAAELAREIDVPTNRVTEIMNGRRAITADTALRLGHWFGTSAEFGLNLQKVYELREAEPARKSQNCRGGEAHGIRPRQPLRDAGLSGCVPPSNLALHRTAHRALWSDGIDQIAAGGTESANPNLSPPTSINRGPSVHKSAHRTSRPG